MSKGSRIIPVRVPDELDEKVKDAIARINRKTKEEPHTTSSFVRKCIEDKLAHMERGKRKTSEVGANGKDTSKAEAESKGRTGAEAEAVAQIQAG